MSQILVACSVWLHSLATVIFIGYYVLLALIYLPALNGLLPEARGQAISAISRRSRTPLYVSLLVIAVTGLHLTLVDPNYMGLGDFRNPWSVLMLVKHAVILGMVGMGFWFNAIMRVGPVASSNTGGAQAVARFRAHVNYMAACGVAVLLLTALAQGQ